MGSDCVLHKIVLRFYDERHTTLRFAEGFFSKNKTNYVVLYCRFITQR